MKGRPIPYDADELAWIEAHRDWPRDQLHAGFVARFDRTDVSLENLKRLCVRKGWRTGRTGQFEKGQTPPNKGRKGFYPPGSEKGWFKPGTRRGIANVKYQPIGTERISKDGYRERKLHDGVPMQSRWRAVHLIEWEALHGPLPADHCLKCLDGDRSNADPENWVAIPRAMLPKLNARWRGVPYDSAPDDLKPTLMAIARLQHEARERRRTKRRTGQEQTA